MNQQAIQFAALDQFNKACVRLRVDEGHSPPLPFVGGAAAASVATMASYPLDLLRTVMAAQARRRSPASHPPAPPLRLG